MNKTSPNPAQIQAWKKEHAVVAITVNLNEQEEVTAYFRKPDFKIIAAGHATCGNDYARLSMFLLNQCYLGGHDVSEEKDVQVLLAFAQQLSSLVVPKMAKLKNV